MKRIRPDYYDKFTCIADQCSITCCRGVEDRRRRRYKPEMEEDFSAGGCPATEKESECLYNGKRRRAGGRAGGGTQISLFTRKKIFKTGGRIWRQRVIGNLRSISEGSTPF